MRVPEDDTGLVEMVPERNFAERVWKTLEAMDYETVHEYASALLDSGYPGDRALGGVLLFLADGLDEGSWGRIVADPDIAVPLTLYDWIRDFATQETARDYRASFKSGAFPRESLYAFAVESAGTFGGGRSAFDLWMEGFRDGAVPADELAGIVTAPGASYDVRSQGLFHLLEPGTREAALEALDGIRGARAGGDSVLLESLAAKIAEIAEISDEGDDCKIWDSQTPVVYYLACSEDALPSRDLANYLEYALRRDDPDVEPNIQEGTWEFANEHLERMLGMGESLPFGEAGILDRIAASLDKLIDYDPAFSPFETVGDDGGNDDGDGDGEDGDCDDDTGDGFEDEGEDSDESVL